MVQHVTIVPKPINPSEPTARPYAVVMWRDDQTIKWGLSGGYSWPNPIGEQPVPIIFLGADPDRGYLPWPGSAPTAIGKRPEPGKPDRRFYTATSDRILDPNEPPEKYHYAFAVCPAEDPSCPLSLLPSDHEAPRHQQWQDEDGAWHDPEVENQNVP